LHSSRQNNHRRPARISEPGASDSARSWAANMGMRCETTEQGPSIRNQKSSINNSHGSPDPSIQARVAGCPSLRVLCARARLQRNRENHASQINQNPSGDCAAPASYPAFNQKSEIINQQFTSTASALPSPRRSRCPHLLSGAKLRMHRKQAGRLPYSSARTKTTHVGAGALTCSAERSSANASNLTQWHSASPGPRLCSESPPNHGASSDDSGPTTDHSNVCSASGLDFALVVCQDARHTEQEEESYAAFSTPDCLLA
jgi:hypothetical protein